MLENLEIYESKQDNKIKITYIQTYHPEITDTNAVFESNIKKPFFLYASILIVYGISVYL